MTREVTILMTVLNAERTLPAALASIRAQTFPDWELLLVDDGSEDRSAQIAAETATADPRIRVMPSGSRRGRSVQLNQLIDVARGPLFAVMDADDVAYPQRLERQVAYLHGHRQVDLVGAAMIVFGVDGRAIGKRAAPREHREICARPRAGFRLFQPTWLGRAEWYRRHRYSERALRCEDQDLLYRSHRTSVFANIDEPLLGYREERLIMRKLLVGRLSWTRVTGGQLWREGQHGHALQIAASQIAKASVDAIAVGTGLGHRLSPQRAGRMSVKEAEEWRQVWESLDPRPPASTRARA
jgi:glycosyltransferase involved in cell wall biosynthesis